MNKFLSFSTPDSPSPSSHEQNYDDSALEGVAANVKLLLKLIQDHKDACKKEKKDGRRMLRVATMMTILDNVRTRIQKCQSFGYKQQQNSSSKQAAEQQQQQPLPLQRRSYTDVKAAAGMHKDEENARLKREMNANLSARKSLEVMCSSLGKEKEIMAAELSRKVHELNGMEELINDLKAQNRTLLDRVHECATEHKEQDKSPITKASSEADSSRNQALQDRNRSLSEQLQRALDGYRSMKRKLREVQEENASMRATIEEMGAKVTAGIERIRGFKVKFFIESGNEDSPTGVDIIRDEIVELEHMFECFGIQVAKHGAQLKGECGKPKGEIINARKPSVLA